MKASKKKATSGGSASHLAGTHTASRRTSGTTARTASRRSGRGKKGAPSEPAVGLLGQKSASERKSGRWIASVTTDSTYPPQGLFTKDASTIARTLASKKVSPKGPASGLRMLIYFINRAGKGLKPARRAELEKAKALLSERIRSRKKSAHKTD